MPWQPVPKAALVGGLVAAGAFWFHAATSRDGFLLLDYVNLPFHEFGHLFFGVFGSGIGLWGGTVMQLLIPFSLFIAFFLRRETSGVAFTLFWLGENLLNIATYAGDARSMALPLVGGGEHDWNMILAAHGLLRYDLLIAKVLRSCGWLAMVGVVSWFTVKALQAPEE